MFDVFWGIILNLLVFTVIGFGPAVFLLSDEKRIESSLAIAPILGFALSSIFGTYLVQLDLPVSKWGIPWVITGSAVSLALCLVTTRKIHRGLTSADWRRFLFFGTGVLLTLLLVTTPMIVGGLDFTVLRGNGTDAFNYITLAGYLDHEPLSWVYQVDTKSLVHRHPSYGLAHALLGTRWTTSMMLALTSSLATIPLYRFEYGFSILSFILAFGPAFLFALRTGIRPIFAFLVAVAVCVGFWAQFVVDVRAVSQTNSVPVILLLALLFARIEASRERYCLGEWFLLAITVVALTFLYPEIVPMTVLALAIYVGACIFRKAYSMRKVVGHLVILGITVLGVLPAAPFLLRFFTHQMTYAASGQNTWHRAYFSWLYSNPLTGLWGLSYLSLDDYLARWLSGGLVQIVMILIGSVLSFILISGLIKGFGSGQKEFPVAFLITICFVCAAIIQFLYLFSGGQLWAAGKGLSFGYAFIMIGTVAYGLNGLRNVRFRWHRFFKSAFWTGITIWLVIQCGLGLYRVGYAYSGRDYRKYIGQHGEYRHHDWNIDDFSKVFEKERANAVWLSTGNAWVSEYLGLVFGWDMNVLNLDGVIRGGKNFSEVSQTPFKLPQYLILSKNSSQNLDAIAPFIEAQNKKLVLVRVSPKLMKNPVWLGMHNPNGIEIDGRGKKFIWMGNGPTILRILAPADGKILLKARYVMGPSLPGKSEREVVISSEEDTQSQRIIVTESTQNIWIPVRYGFNEIGLEVTDIPTVSRLSNGDTRPLLLGVSGLEVSFGRPSIKNHQKGS